MSIRSASPDPVVVAFGIDDLDVDDDTEQTTASDRAARRRRAIQRSRERVPYSD